MDDLIGEFLEETGEQVALLDRELVRLEQNPGDTTILANISTLVHTIKGTSGFLGLKRLEAVAQAVEHALGQASPGSSFVLLEALAQIKHIMVHLARHGEEPAGDDAVLIAQLHGRPAPAPRATPQPAPARETPRVAEAPRTLPSLAMHQPLTTEPTTKVTAISPQAQREALRHGLETPLPPGRRALLEKMAWAIGELIALRRQFKPDEAPKQAALARLEALTRGLAETLRASQGEEQLGVDVIALLPVQTACVQFALPERYVLELLDASAPGHWRVETIHNTRVLLSGNRVVPLVSLAALMNLPSTGESKIAVIKVGEAEFALGFGTFDAPQESLQRPLPRLLSAIGLYRGAAVVGGETPLPVLDPAGIARAIGYRQVNDVPPRTQPQPVAAAEAPKLASFLLVRSAEGSIKALRLEEVSRIESRIERSEDLHLATLPGAPADTSGEVVLLEGTARDGRRLALAVAQVLDVVEGPSQLAPGHTPGYLGTLKIGNISAELLDVERLREREGA